MAVGLDRINSRGRPWKQQRLNDPGHATKQPSFVAEPKTPNGSKLQDVLGLSDAEMSAMADRNDSLSSTSTAQPQSASLSEATTVPVSTGPDVDALATPSLLPPLETHHAARSHHGFYAPDTTRGSEGKTVLKSIGSGSSLVSSLDDVEVPLKFSTQPHVFSDYKSSLLRETCSPLSPPSPVVEHHRPMLFFRTSRSRPWSTQKKPKERAYTSPVSPRGNASLQQSLRESMSRWREVGSGVLQHSATTVREGLQHSKSAIQLFTTSRQLPVGEDATPTVPDMPRYQAHMPHYKIHVRRPKAGAVHWFDHLDIDTTDDESNGDLEPNPDFGSTFQNTFGARRISLSRSHSASSRPSSLTRSSIKRRSLSDVSVPRSIAAAARTILVELPDNVPVPETFAAPKKASSRDKMRSRCLNEVDLNEFSMLSLSVSDSESEVDNNATPVARRPPIRDSLAIDQLDNSDVEIGTAQAVQPRRPDAVRKLAIQDPSVRRVQDVILEVPEPDVEGKPVAALTITTTKHQSRGCDPAETDMLGMFPATPKDVSDSLQHRFRDSLVSDDASFISTRTMQVTKQEQKLLAAMRLKKASVKAAQKNADRRSALQALEAGAVTAPAASYTVFKLVNDGSNKFDRRSSKNGRTLSRHVRRRSRSCDDGLRRASTLTTATSIDSAPDELQTSRSGGDRPTNLRLRFSRAESEESDHRSGYTRDTISLLLSETTASSDSRTLEFDELLERRNVPSQLFMEHPYVGWDRVEVTTAH